MATDDRLLSSGVRCPEVSAGELAGLVLEPLAGHHALMRDASHDDHVGLYAGPREDGSPFIELVPARRLEEGLYEVVGTPGIANGCAAGDRIAVDGEGGFTVTVRGGNVALHVYCRGTLLEEDIDGLRQRFSPLGGLVEAPGSARFAVVTVPAAVGFALIEEAITGWAANRADVEWHYGNVYDEAGEPLNWW